MNEQDPKLIGPLQGLSGRDLELGAGVFLFRREDSVEFVYEVLNGRIALSRTLADGRELLLAVALPGEIVAEASLHSSHYHCDGVARSSSRLKAVSKVAVQNELEFNREFARAYLERQALQIHRLRGLLELRNIKRADDRVVHWIAMHASDGNGWAEVAGTLKDWAAQIGMSHEVAYRAVARLVQDNVIERRPGGFRVRP